MERTKKQHHRAVTPAPKAFPSWKTPQPSPGSDNTASASSQSRGRDPSLLFIPFFHWICHVEWPCQRWGWWCPWMAGNGLPRGKCHPRPAFPSPAGSRWLLYVPPTAPAPGAEPTFVPLLLVAGGAHPAGDVVLVLTPKGSAGTVLALLQSAGARPGAGS